MARLPLLVWCLPLLATAASVPYSEYILAPSSRTLTAPTVHEVNGTVQNAEALITASTSSRTSNSSAIFVGANSSVTLDFGKNIAGNVRFQVDAVSGSNEYISIGFTESSMWISPDKCDATQDEGLDDPLWFAISGPGTYAADITHQRGGFRYLNVLHNSTGSVSLSTLSVNWTAVPQMSDPREYTGYFHSSSEKLNRVWYAGAYTNQLCSIDSSTGSALRLPLSGWAYNYTIASTYLLLFPVIILSTHGNTDNRQTERPCSSTAPNGTASSGLAISSSQVHPSSCQRTSWTRSGVAWIHCSPSSYQTVVCRILEFPFRARTRATSSGVSPTISTR